MAPVLNAIAETGPRGSRARFCLLDGLSETVRADISLGFDDAHCEELMRDSC